MRLSIWQQFSSNHSDTFTIMGRFETAQQAREVGETIREILVKVAKWREQVQSEDEDVDLTDSEMQLEAELLEQYGLDAPLETLDFARDSDFAADAVLIFDRAVIIAEGLIDEYTWSGSSAFDGYLKQHGAQVASYSEMGTSRIAIDITCTAPDDTTAAELTARMNANRAGLHLTITGLQESNDGQDFIDHIEYLRSKGCTDIDYTFHEEK